MPEKIKPVILRTPVPPGPPTPQIQHRSLHEMIWSDNPQEVKTALLVTAWQKRVVANRVRAYTHERLCGKRLDEIPPALKSAETQSYIANLTAFLNAIQSFYQETNDTPWYNEIDRASDVWRCPVEVDSLDCDYLNRLWGTIWLLLIWHIAATPQRSKR